MPRIDVIFGLLFLELIGIGHVTMGGDLWASESL